MHIFLTGASGHLGSYVQDSLHAKGHTVTATDIAPRKDATALPSGSIFVQADLRDYHAVEEAMRRIPCDAVMHLAAIPSPIGGQDQREIHNTNVVTSYNVLRTAADLGIKRIVQASSVNATGLAYSKEENVWFEELPLHEGSAMRPEDPYSKCGSVRAQIPSRRRHFTCRSVQAVSTACPAIHTAIAHA